MEKKLLILLVNIFLLCGGVLAQTKVTGTVVSQEDGEPIIGASIIIQGQRSGTVTDADGNGSWPQKRFYHSSCRRSRA